MTMRFGAQLWSQQASWPEWRDAGLAAEAAGWDSIWTWDQLPRSRTTVANGPANEF